MTALTQRVRDETGSILPLIAIFAGVCLVLILVVTAITSLYVERKRLFTLADSAALVGAEAFDITGETGDGPPRVSTPDVQAAVDDYLTAHDRARFEGFTVTHAGTPDGRSAVVTLAARWRPPLIGPILPDGVRLEVTARARTVLW